MPRGNFNLAVMNNLYCGRLIFIHHQCWEVLPFCRFQRQRCIKIRVPRARDFYTPLALKTAKGQHLPALVVYKNQSPILVLWEQIESSVFCENAFWGSLCHLSSVPLSAPRPEAGIDFFQFPGPLENLLPLTSARLFCHIRQHIRATSDNTSEAYPSHVRATTEILAEVKRKEVSSC